MRNNLRNLAQQKEEEAKKRNEQEEIGRIVMAMTVGKGTGMSDAEWNEIVRTTVKKEK